MSRVLKSALVLVVMLGLVSLAHAKPEIGKEAPQFELKDIQGNSHKLSDFKGKVVVLHFQSVSCPWEKAYQPILNDLYKKHSHVEKDGERVEQVVFLAVNSNKTESLERVKEYNSENVAYPSLKDEGSKVADLYAAQVTPHVYVICREGTLRYMGGIEKAPTSPRQAGKSDEQYLEPAIAAVLKGSEISEPVTKPIGCGIKR